MSCAQRGIDSATAAVDLEAAGEGVPGILVPSNRLHQRDADRKRGFNRTENVRASPFRHHSGIKAISRASRRTIGRYRVLTHLRSLHLNALVMTWVAISARLSTGPGRPV
jgi:hypothetical protein